MVDSGRFRTDPRWLDKWDSHQFSVRATYHLAEHAVAIYQPRDAYVRRTLRAGYCAKFFSCLGAQAGIAYNDSSIIITARGSSELIDWAHNLLSSFVVKADHGVLGKVGLGVRIQTRRLWRRMAKPLAEIVNNYPSARVFVVGHSLGGMLAYTLTDAIDSELRVRGSGHRVASMVAFDPARVGDINYEKGYDERRGDSLDWAIVNTKKGEADIVTRLPPYRWGRRRPARTVVFGDDGVPVLGHEKWREYRNDNPKKSYLITPRLPYAIQAHLGKNILEAYRRLMISRVR